MKAKNVTFCWDRFNGDLSGPNMTFGRLTSNDTLLMSLYNSSIQHCALSGAMLFVLQPEFANLKDYIFYSATKFSNWSFTFLKILT